MYDCLCLLPHANASHSLIHYLNLHKEMHIASYTSIVRSLDDILAYERNFRPFIKTVGVATKDYDAPDIVNKVLNACRRKLIIQTVRDPVECLVSQINNGKFIVGIREVLGQENSVDESIEKVIADAATRYITHGEADSFDEHIVIDVADLKGDLIEGDHFADGCVILLDDFLCNRGSKAFGMRRAWLECATKYQPELTDLGPFGTASWCFIVHRDMSPS